MTSWEEAAQPYKQTGSFTSCPCNLHSITYTRVALCMVLGPLLAA